MTFGENCFEKQIKIAFFTFVHYKLFLNYTKNQTVLIKTKAELIRPNITDNFNLTLQFS